LTSAQSIMILMNSTLTILSKRTRRKNLKCQKDPKFQSKQSSNISVD